MRKFQIIGCVDAASIVRRHYAAVLLELTALHPDVAARAGFAIDDDGTHWTRELTPEVVAYEIKDLDWCVSAKVFPAQLVMTNGEIETSPDFPDDANFKDAWVLTDGAVLVDMARARDMHRSRLRLLRTPLLAALDVEYQRADESGNIEAKKSIASRKQALRDVTKDRSIDAAKTVEALARAVPAALSPTA